MRNIVKKIVVLVIFAGLTTSCGLYTKYQRSEEVIPSDSLYNFIHATEDTTSIASLSWKEIFTDQQLQELIEYALENNSDLNVARLSVEQAEALLRVSKLAYFPSINATPQGAISSYSGATTKTYNLSIAASWEIDIFGKYTNAKEGARAAFESSNAYRQMVQTQLIATIASSYYTLLMTDEQIAISCRTAENWSENIRVLEALKRTGRTNESAVAQAQANKIALEASIVSLKKQQSDIMTTLASLLGITPQEIKRGSLYEFKSPESISVGLPIQLLSNRPDVRMAEFNLAEKFYGTNEARASFYPQLTLSGALGFTNSGGSGISNPGAMLYSAVASLVQPIFNQGTLRAQLTISKAQQEQALIEFKQSLLDAGIEVNNAMVQLESATERLELVAKRIEALQRALRSSELLMQYSESSYLEVLVAENSLLLAELSQTSDIYDQIEGVINLYRSLGGGVR